jgi:hypothetical protein
MLRKTPSLLGLFKKRKEEEKRNPRGIRFHYTPFHQAWKDRRGISDISGSGALYLMTADNYMKQKKCPYDLQK